MAINLMCTLNWSKLNTDYNRIDHFNRVQSTKVTKIYFSFLHFQSFRLVQRSLFLSISVTECVKMRPLALCTLGLCRIRRTHNPCVHKVELFWFIGPISARCTALMTNIGTRSCCGLQSPDVKKLPFL